MKTIVCVDEKWGIGRDNDLLFSIKEDMAYFTAMTLNKVVVMGSNTLLSLPNGKPLKNRVNIVLWPDGKRDDVVLLQSLDELFQELKGYNQDDVFVIGGAMLYRTLLPYCSEAYITKVQADGNASVFFDNLDLMSEWQLESESEVVDNTEYKFSFCKYVNKSKKEWSNGNS